jgi:hypothetical protein
MKPKSKRVRKAPTAKRDDGVTIATDDVKMKPTPESLISESAGKVLGQIRIRQAGYETVIDFDHAGELRKAWNDIAMRVQNGQSVQIGDHIFVGALQATMVKGLVPETRATRKLRRKQKERADHVARRAALAAK